MRIAAYTRVSSADQVERLSLATQEQLIRAYCVRQDWPEPAFFTDAGKSAYNDEIEKRPRMAALVEAIQSREYDVLIVYDYDRLARNAVMQLTIAQQLQRFGCRLVSLNQTTDLATPEGKMLYTFNAGINEFFSAQISRKSKAGLAHIRAQGGHVGGLHYGARRDAARRLELDPAKADTLALILRLAAQGSYDAVATALNARGSPTPRGGPAWRSNTIASMVRSGRWLLDQPPPWPALWSAAANRPRIAHGNRTKRTNTLTGMLRCACGGVIVYSGVYELKRGGRTASVQCRYWGRERPGGTRCPYPKMRADRYEALAEGALLALPDLTGIDITPPDIAAAREALRARRLNLARGVALGLPGDEEARIVAAIDEDERAVPLDSGTEHAVATELLIVQASWQLRTVAERCAAWHRLATRIVITGRTLRVEWVPAIQRLLDAWHRAHPARPGM